jgi:hypothetical protein
MRESMQIERVGEARERLDVPLKVGTHSSSLTLVFLWDATCVAHHRTGDGNGLPAPGGQVLGGVMKDDQSGRWEFFDKIDAVRKSLVNEMLTKVDHSPEQQEFIDRMDEFEKRVDCAIELLNTKGLEQACVTARLLGCTAL